jgi:hypothetical protein
MTGWLEDDPEWEPDMTLDIEVDNPTITAFQMAQSVTALARQIGGAYKYAVEVQSGELTIHAKVDGDRVGDFWTQYTYLTGLPQRFINAVARKVKEELESP